MYETQSSPTTSIVAWHSIAAFAFSISLNQKQREQKKWLKSVGGRTEGEKFDWTRFWWPQMQLQTTITTSKWRRNEAQKPIKLQLN